MLQLCQLEDTMLLQSFMTSGSSYLSSPLLRWYLSLRVGDDIDVLLVDGLSTVMYSEQFANHCPLHEQTPLMMSESFSNV